MSIKIMLDAGHHGLCNHSPVVPEYYESTFNWDFHLLLKSELEKYGFQVNKTRTTKNTPMENYDRGLLASGYDLFISIHSNSCDDDETVDRPVVFYPYDGQNNSIILANSLCSAVKTVMQLSGTPQVTTRINASGNEYYGVMRGARYVNCPRYYIIEHSFFTNTDAATWMLIPSNLERMARVEAYIIAKDCGLAGIKGDLNRSGNITTIDYLKVKRYLLGAYQLTAYEELCADIDFDGVVTETDLILIQQMMMGTYILPY